MPFFTTIKNEYGHISVWKLTEKWEELLPQITLSKRDQERFNAINFEKRKTEFLATRILLKLALGENESIDYNANGKPFLRDGKKQISISHSASYACIFIADKKVGIDIELSDRSIERIADRFLQHEEKKQIAELADLQLARIVYWSAKEAIFKCADIHGIRFNEQIKIRPFLPGDEVVFYGQFVLHGKVTEYRLKLHLIENNVLVFCVEN